MTRNHLLDVPNNTNASWWRDKGLRLNVLHCIGCCLCTFYLGYDQALLAALQAIPQWNKFFNYPKGTNLGLIASALYFPGLLSAFVGSWLSMRFGRRPTLWIGSAMIIVGAILNALSRNVGEFCGGRVLLGAGGAITKVAAPPLLQEIAHPRLRSKLAASYYGWFFLGSSLSSWLCLGGIYLNENNWSWRMPCLFQIVAPIIVILITLHGPESPRFLVNKGRHAEALRVLAKYHANGSEDDPLVQLEFHEIVAAIEAEGGEHKSSWLDLFRTKGNRRRSAMSIIMACGTNWTGSGLVGYYLTPILNSVGITAPVQTISLNAGLALWNLLACQLAATQVERVSRRTSFFTSGWGMAISMGIITGFSAAFAQGNKSMGLAVVPFLFIFFFFYDIAWMALPFHYCTEIMPFHLRTKGLAVFTATQTFANAFNQFINPIAFLAIAWRYYIVYVVINLAVMVYFYIYLIDTRALSLEEITLLFDYDRREARDRAAEEMKSRVRGDYERGLAKEKEADVESAAGLADDDAKKDAAIVHIESK